MWIVYALIVHVLLLGSIFVIYFRSPVIEGLQPQPTLPAEPPADRLVLIVTDGLRADSFFTDNCNHVPHLREIFLQDGLVGISRTHVPTESRPGHIALIAGLYEDPSAVTRGWKENPIEFDTVFNRSGHTYAWGAHDVLHIFEKLTDGGRPMYFDAYHDLDFSGQQKTYKQDEWVFQRVRQLLKRKQEELRSAKKVVFFLHLLGLDTAGHVHKPGTPLFLENLQFTEKGIAQIYEKFEEIFPDKRTAYLLTSDHGMTDSGSHGAGAAHETETPFMLWGAGAARSASPTRSFVANDEGQKLPLHELEQAQLAPLMSALIGLPPPMNNFGMLPTGYMSVGVEYEAMAAQSNALQLLAQYTRLHKQHQRGLFTPYMKSFKKLTTLGIFDFSTKTATFAESSDMMQLALEGIDYYHGYYRNVMLLCTTATFLGWILYLYRLLIQGPSIRKQPSTGCGDASALTLSITIGGVFLIGFIVAQFVPFAVGFYMLLPLPVWLLALRQTGSNSNVEVCDYRYPSVARRGQVSKLQFVLLIACAELLVYTFFERRLISLCFVAFAFGSNWSNFKRNSSQFYIWILLVLVLAGFPLLPPSVGYQNRYLLLVGIVLVLLRAVLSNGSRSYSWHTKWCNPLILINTAVCVHLHSQQVAVPMPLKVASWLYLVYAVVSIQLNKEVALELRLAHILYNLSAVYTLLCTSYESLFVQLLAMELSIALAAQRQGMDSLQQQYHQRSLQSSLRLAFTVLLYTFFSLFGSGNIASISSFDPNIARCFLSQFAPFMIMSLVLVKLILPVVLNLSIVYTYCDYARKQERQIFICLLIICDIMGLNFLFLVRNTGSWLEIGSSISHFVIMEATTLVLLLLSYLAKHLLRLNSCDRAVTKHH
ncbi:GPI ethanolamine phosphate transferase 1 [Drosophila sulfurigaster albostrigata]|uniref:GPI ethanolamine phosphate transferase 1 n=1 Tax=Drosophila sulfurigaster albostrigata TaxID=89887 RepID=UPI002D21BE2F|nr:GPI ethanolamine phosphate transferase 1 [Drosophila sulfurigaster albostrigata]